jgi:hypothetical protein
VLSRLWRRFAAFCARGFAHDACWCSLGGGVVRIAHTRTCIVQELIALAQRIGAVPRSGTPRHIIKSLPVSQNGTGHEQYVP